MRDTTAHLNSDGKASKKKRKEIGSVPERGHLFLQSLLEIPYQRKYSQSHRAYFSYKTQ